MKKFEIPNSDYMVIASYCLYKITNIGDLDVVITILAYNKLKNSGIFEESIVKISGDERLVLKFPEIDEFAEIEIFTPLEI
jgi:hypothetical protein